MHEFLTSFCNASNTISERLGADIPNAPHKAVMFDSNGDVVLAADPSKAIGILLSDTPQTDSDAAPTAKKGSAVSILIKNIGLLEAGESITKGALVTINASGQGVPAASGSFIFGRAFSSASAAGQLFQVQINPSGYNTTS